MNEFELIRHYFCFSTPDGRYPAPDADSSSPVALGVGDDCALLNIPLDRQLAVTTDTLVSGVHFTTDGPPGLIARRALRVNLSDLAAMGATPLGFQLALTLPALDRNWLELFSAGLAEDAERFACPLIGGDTTRGPLSITITMMGTVPRQQALTRSGANAGDIICVSGTLGDAALALEQLASPAADAYLLERYWLPEPRLTLGRLLGSRASAGLDVSDGLLQDVGHIARASGLTACIELEKVPVSSSLLHHKGDDAARRLAISGGDDYELCFTASERALAEIDSRAIGIGCRITRIGQMLPLSADGVAVICVDDGGHRLAIRETGYDHFQH